MSKQYNKVEKRKRRAAYLKRKKTVAKKGKKGATAPAAAAPAEAAPTAAS